MLQSNITITTRAINIVQKEKPQTNLIYEDGCKNPK